MTYPLWTVVTYNAKSFPFAAIVGGMLCAADLAAVGEAICMPSEERPHSVRWRKAPCWRVLCLPQVSNEAIDGRAEAGRARP